MRKIYLFTAVLYLTAEALYAQQPLRTWGSNQYGMLGQGSSTLLSTASPTQVGTANWIAADGGDFFSAGIQSDGTLWAWGDQSEGKVGDGSTMGTATGMLSPLKISTDTTWTALSCGSSFTLAIKKDHSLWGWGDNDEHAMGIITPSDVYVPTQLGNNTTDWQSVNAGDAHVLAIKTNGTLWAWGDNDFGKLGIGTSASIAATPTQVGTGTDWAMVAAGEECSLGIKTDGTLWGWGQSTTGGSNTTSPVQIGTATDWKFVSSSNNSHFAIKNDGTLWAWGNNFVGQLGIGSSVSVTVPTQVGTDNNWISVRGGYMHTLALKADHTLWAMGASEALGMVSPLGENKPKQVGTANNWTAIAAGSGHSLALGGQSGTGIAEYLAEKKVTVYPNPTADFLNIDAKQPVENVSIAAINGQQLYSGTSMQINVRSFKPGIYYYRVTLKDQHIYAGSFVKQ